MGNSEALADAKEVESRDTTLEALEEHKVMKRLVKELDKNQKGTEEWAAKLKVLQENTEHHVEEAETELFPECKKFISTEESEEIALEIEKFKKEQLSTKK